MNYPSPDKITDVNFVPMVPGYVLVPENKSELTLFGNYGLHNNAQMFSGIDGFANDGTMEIPRSPEPWKILITNNTVEKKRITLFAATKNFTAVNHGNPVGVTIMGNGAAYVEMLAQTQTIITSISIIRMTLRSAVPPEKIFIKLSRLTDPPQFESHFPLQWTAFSRPEKINRVEWHDLNFELNSRAEITMDVPGNFVAELELFPSATSLSAAAVNLLQSGRIGTRTTLQLSPAALAALRG